MAPFRCHCHLSAAFPALIFAALAITGTPAFPQNAPQTQTPGDDPRPATHDSVDVVEHLSPEEAEEGKLNDAYQSVARLQHKGDCTADIIKRYESDVIGPAEKSTFNVPKNKFLFLANSGIGDCYLAQQKFAEAEASFQKLMQYVPVWPGTNDSAYPMNFQNISIAQMGQEHWPAAEQSLLKSIALFDQQIAAGEKRDAERQTQFSSKYHGPQSENYSLLAVVYLREGRVQDALKTVETAYDQATKYDLAPRYREEVENVGKAIANASGNADAQKTWSQRGAAK